MIKKKLSLLLLPLAATLSLQAANPFDDPFFNDPFGDDIFKEMMQMQKEMDKMFERMQQRMNQRSSGLVSPLGTYKMAVQNQLVDKGDHYELRTNIPESKENHIDIKTANGMMRITAKVVQEREQKSQYGISQSRSVRMYQQSTSLPSDADDGQISTAYRDGKLVVSIAKKSGAVKAIAPASTTPSNNTPAAAPSQPSSKKAEKIVVPKEQHSAPKTDGVKKEKVTTPPLGSKEAAAKEKEQAEVKPMTLHTDMHEMS